MPEPQKTRSASKTRTGPEISGSQGPSTNAILEQAQTWQQKSKNAQQNTEKALRREFQQWQNAIVQRLGSEQEKTETAISDANHSLRASLRGLQSGHWLIPMLSLIPLLLVFLMGVGLTLFLVFQERYQVVAVEMNEQGVWTRCETISDNQRWCMIREAD